MPHAHDDEISTALHDLMEAKQRLLASVNRLTQDQVEQMLLIAEGMVRANQSRRGRADRDTRASAELALKAVRATPG